MAASSRKDGRAQPMRAEATTRRKERYGMLQYDGGWGTGSARLCMRNGGAVCYFGGSRRGKHKATGHEGDAYSS